MSKKYWFLLLLILFFLGLKIIKFNHWQSGTTILDMSLINGIDVVMSPSLSNLVSVQAWVRTGTINENKKNNGLSHFLEHMIFKNKHWVNKIEENGGYFNAATSLDFTYYYITINRENVNLVLTALGELLFNNDFTEADFTNEKKVILEEIDRANENPDYIINNIIHSSLYTDHPYGLKVLGEKNNIQNYTLLDLKDYYQKYYRPNNITFVITGGFDKKKIMKSLKVLEKYPNKDIVPPPLIRDKNFISRKYTGNIKNLTIPTLFYAYSVPGIDSDDTYVLDVLMYVLGNRENSILNRRLKEELDLSYSITAGYQTRKKRSLFMIEIPLKNISRINTVKNEYRNLLKNMELTEEELDLIKVRLTKEYYLELEKVENVGFGLGYYSSLASYKYWRDYLVNLKKVTIEDIKNVIKKYFDEESQFLFLPG